MTEGIAFTAEIYRVPIAAPAPVVYGDGPCDISLPPSDGDEIDAPFFRQVPADELDLGAAGPVTIQSSGGVGASFMHINLKNSAAVIDCYPAAGSSESP